MTLMGLTWWVYGTIGMLGTAPHWVVSEVVYPDLNAAALDVAHTRDTSPLPPAEEYKDLEPDALAALIADAEPELNGWELPPASTRNLGYAKATVDASLGGNPRSETRRVGKQGVSTGRARGGLTH